MPQKLVVFVVGLVLFLAASAGAQPGRLYDPKTVATVQGQVASLASAPSQGRWGSGQMLRLKTGQETLLVHLGPAEFLAQQNFAPKVGDTLTITGSKLTTGQGTVLLAQTIKAGGQTITLRNDQGRPLWRGQGRQRFYAPQEQPPPPAR